VQFAPRFSPRLLDAIERLATHRGPIAEINRQVGAEAERMGLPRPSYQRVRELVHEARELQHGYVSATQLMLEIATLQRSARDYQKLATLPERPRLRNRLAK
jgi:hypothetical protein